MRVAQVNYAVDPRVCDPDRWLDRCPTLARWARSLVEAGADSVLVAQRFGRDAEFERDGVQYLFRAEHGLRSRWPAACARLHAAVGAWGPQVVQVNGLIFPVQTLRLRRALPPATAIVLQDHGGVSRPRTSWRAGLRAADAILFTALPQAAIWRLQSGDPLVLEVPEAGCDLEPVSQALARERSGVRGHPAVVWVGRLNETKDPLTVLEGFRLAAADLPDAHLTFIYSADELLSELRRRVEATECLRTRVTFRGDVPHDRLPEYLSAADLFVLGSRREGSGYALMEALACGNVAVVTDIPSFRAITLDGSLGVLWRPGYPRACAAALLDAVQRDLAKRRPEATNSASLDHEALFNSPATRGLAVRARLAGSRASIRERFMAEYGWKAVGEKALAAYREAVAARGASASRLLSASASQPAQKVTG